MATTTTTHGDADGLSFPGSSRGVDDVILIIRKYSSSHIILKKERVCEGGGVKRGTKPRIMIYSECECISTANYLLQGTHLIAVLALDRFTYRTYNYFHLIYVMVP